MWSMHPSFQIEIQAHLSAPAPSLVLRLQLDTQALQVHGTQLGQRLALPGWPRSGPVGGPGLPSRALWVALPLQTVVSEAPRVRVLRQVPLAATLQALVPQRAPWRDAPDGLSAARPTEARVPALYLDAAAHSPPLVRVLGTQRCGATLMVQVQVQPVQVLPNGQLTLVSELEVTLPLAVADDRPALLGQPVPVSGAQQQRMLALARALVVNPGDVPGPGVRTVKGPALRDLPPCWDYLILTDDTLWNAAAKTPGAALGASLVSAFEPLAAWKTRLGLRARVVKLADIVASRKGSGFGQDFSTGAADLQHIIRRFLRWAHDSWGTAYVLLGGDERIVPFRHLAIGSGSHPSMPTDLYYAALNPSNDEWTEGAKPDIAGYGFERLLPHLSIGRAPAANAAQATNFVTKTCRYEALREGGNPLAHAWLSRILYVSSKWGGDVPTVLTPAASFPPAGDRFAADAARQRTVIHLVDMLPVARDANPSADSPGEGRFSQPSGKTYLKLHLRGTCRNPKTVVALTATGARVSLLHDAAAGPQRPGWYYTDWMDKDGPCRDAMGQNNPTVWLIAFLPSGTVATSLEVQLAAELRLAHQLLARGATADYQVLAHDVQAAAKGKGWCFVASATDAAPLPLEPATGLQKPSSWIAVYGSAAERAPQAYLLDPSEQADTMREQESLRRRIRQDMPGWDSEAALYPDVADLPDADRQGIDLQYYSRERLLARLNQGQHIVSIGGHGNVGLTCSGGEGGSFDTALADALTNGPNCGIAYANSCLTNRCSEDSLSRHLVMNNANGGMTAYVGYADEISIGLGHAVEDKFFADLARTGVLGLALDARAGMVLPGSGFDPTSRDLRYTTFMMGLLGDPALKVHGADREVQSALALDVSTDTAGRLNVLYLRPDHRIAQLRQNPAIGGWSRADVIDRGSWASHLVSASNADGRLECFYIGSDSKIYHLWQTTPGGAWSQSGVLDMRSTARQLVALAHADHRIELVYIGSDDRLYHIHQTAPNNGWAAGAVLDPGSFARQAAGATNRDGRLELVYIGSDNKLYHLWQTAPNNGWSGSGVLDKGSYARQLALGSNQDGRIEVVYIGSDNKLYHLWQTAPNNGWSGSGVLDNGSFARQLAVKPNRDGRLEVVYIGSDNKLYHLWQTAPNNGWSGSGVLTNAGPAKQVALAVNADQRLEVVYIGTDDRLYHLWQKTPGGAWSAGTALLG
ncbi:hypothetical protein BurJ1DRAFT_4992 [Burkholderiales bacterium JOSHI_001]|nr:hypothetical protein BurJ1DRAFT_4992 [Burkholderiales bacterium JOSHI_001]